jgi:Nif-specific regulatory protein
MVDRIARTDSAVWIIGEAGVGKELFAEQIHVKSGRKDFVRVNCALRSSVDWKDGATVFFDEISSLNLLQQEKLLNRLKHSSFRIIASTKRDIELMIKEGTFLRELYYKLNVLPIFIPPLRERKDDIIPLANYFLKLFILDTKNNIEDFSTEAKEALLAYYWKGNVRELKICVEYACIQTRSTLVYKDELLIHNGNSRLVGRVGDDERDFKKVIDAFKKVFIEKVMEEVNGNQTEAAKLMGLNRTYVSRLVKELQIKKEN